MTIDDELKFLEDRIADVRKTLMVKDNEVLRMQLKYMNNYRQMLIYRIRKGGEHHHG